MHKPIVSIVIPTHHREKQLRRLVASIHKSTYAPIEVIIVNDGANSRGLAYSRNKGAIKAKGKYILFIDDDNVISPDMIEKLVIAMEHNNKLLALGPITYYLADKTKVWFAGGSFNLTTTIPSFVRGVTRSAHPHIIPVDVIHNCLMLRARQGASVGWFDEYVYMGGTEFDLISRIRKRYPGMWVGVATHAVCYHDIPLPSNNFMRNKGFNHEKRAYYFQRNRAVLIKRYANPLQVFFFLLFFYPFFLLLYTALFMYNRKWSYLSSQAKGVYDGYKYALFNLT